MMLLSQLYKTREKEEDNTCSKSRRGWAKGARFLVKNEKQ